jgi:cell division septum initiation protein DivIVA
VRQEAKKILQDATEAAQSAAKGILDAARAEATQITQEATQKAQTEAKGILQQAHKDAASLEPLAETIRAFQDAPEGMQQLALNLEATEEVAMEALRRLGVAEKRLDLFGEYAGQDRDPPPVLELVMKRTGRRAQEKTNDLMATLARNGPRR